MSKEVWRQIDGWPYEVSNLGRVRRTESAVGTYKGRILSPFEDRTGYEIVHLHHNGEDERRRVHRLVLRAFVGPCPEGHESDHINGVRDDNRLENLRWLQISENRGRHPLGVSTPFARLTRNEVIEIRVTYATVEGATYKGLAEKYDVCPPTIGRVTTGRTWRSAPGPIKGVDYE